VDAIEKTATREELVSRIGVDIGGTFTDVGAVDEDGRLYVGKRLTTHGAESDGVLAAVVDTKFNLSRDALIVAHGTTLVINALLERKGSKVAIVTTTGFADLLDIARATRSESFNLRYRRDPPLVPRDQRLEIDERTDATGAIIKRPTDEDLERLVSDLRALGAEAVAIAFLHSYIQPANEELVADHIRRTLGVPVTTSNALSRQWREYERFSTASANAYVAPVAKRYLGRLLEGLGGEGFSGQFVVLDSSGGAMSVDTATRVPVRAVESGPVAGVIGGRTLAHSLGIKNLVVFDMGGTTAKVSLVEDGEFATMDQYWIGGRSRGFPLQISTVDIVEVSVGGGSIAWLDDSGSLRVGPRSAGSQPGPACYGLGGTQATVTDANLYCGRLEKDHFIGSLRLDPEAASEAIEKLAEEAGLPPMRLALGTLQLANLQIASAVRRQTLERGRDPQEFTLLAVGGAGPMHGCEVAAEAGIREVLVPLFPGHFSALGMLGANLRVDRREVLLGLLEELDPERLQKTITRIADELGVELRFGSEDHVNAEVRYSLHMRYRGQEHTVRVALPDPGAQVPREVRDALRAAFEAEYVRRYGHLDHTSRLETVELEVVASRALPQVKSAYDAPPLGNVAEIETFWAERPAPLLGTVVPRGLLSPGEEILGPAVIFEEGSTSVIPPGARVNVADDRTLRVDVSQM
jgi:N-methylhydantoinase A